ncbi:MAG: type II toxin-antitoxin system RelE/ParE family toxin [Planctomycetes bacterium]|nr:type II toxin-antitoxin system RelE/ParE family toxin [Planctomycetota bacterium]
MARSVRLSDEALLQIVGISDYISKDSQKNAQRWRTGLRSKIKSLQNLPTRHAILYTLEQAGREVRQTFYGTYRILYTIEKDTVTVLTVRHGAQRPIGPKEVDGIE